MTSYTGVQGGTWSMRATGLLSVDPSSSYTLQASVDDQVRVWVDDVLVLSGASPGTYLDFPRPLGRGGDRRCP